MVRYKVSFFKNLLSSDGHPFKCLQYVIRVDHARSRDRAILAAQRRFERLRRVPNWELYADMIELEADGGKIQSLHAAPGRASYPSGVASIHRPALRQGIK